MTPTVFQFQYGSIKSCFAGLDRSGNLGFNSSMVRLKDILTSESGSVKLMFQFQYGSIKSLLEIYENEPIANVSIPVWFD